jgi:phosphohistidine phosphatase
MPKRLYLLRHAKSSWDDPGVEDHDRPLNPRGRDAARRLATHFRISGIRPDLVLCSSAARAVETLAPISEAVGLHERTRIDTGIYGASAGQLLERLRELDDRVGSVLVIGHNPGLQELAIGLAADDRQTLLRLWGKFPTGTLVEVVSDGATWRDLSPQTAHFVRMIVPGDLPG